jgi:hypothetical protein
MTYETFESLKVGDRLQPVLKKRSYPVIRIGKSLSGVRTVYVCLNPCAVDLRGEYPHEFGIFRDITLKHSTHYLNWDKVS